VTLCKLKDRIEQYEIKLVRQSQTPCCILVPTKLCALMQQVKQRLKRAANLALSKLDRTNCRQKAHRDQRNSQLAPSQPHGTFADE
jgi:hypothetical protein